MRVNPVNVLIAILLAGVISYGLWSMGSELRNYVAIGSFIFLSITLVPLLLGAYASDRRGVNLRVVSGLFFAIALVLNGVFALINLPATAYIVGSALLFLIYVLLANSIYNAKQ